MLLNSRRAALLFVLLPCALTAATVDTVERGRDLFQQKCAFCHGRDAEGGETGPDLTASQVVKTDVNGDKIGYVVRNGRPEKGMPRFELSDDDLAAVVAFIHKQAQIAASQSGGRKGVTPADLQSGDAKAGERYFNGPGGCSGCHSVSGDLAHVASKRAALRLELRMLYPQDAAATLTVTTRTGQTISGELAYRDEFTLALRDHSGAYRSWPVKDVKYKIDDPAEAHWNLLSKYTDTDIHNLFAYLITLQ